MDQNQPRDDATGAQPPAEPNQAAAPDPNQAATGGSQDAAAEYAAWSADSTYQQQPAQQPPSQQPAQPSDTQAFAAPEPQSATYTEAPTQSYEQQAQQPYDAQAQQAYDTQAYQQQYAQGYQQPQQQAYDQQAYQQQAYQQQPQQQQPQQQAYDQQAYQQYYQQQYQQGYQQPQQPQYYDQSAYGQQQPGYYDQSAYGQQQGYQQPYAYGQPGQQPWPGDAQYWEEGGSRYGRSFLAVLAGFALLTWGIVIAMGGALMLWTNDLLGYLDDITLSAEVQDIVERMDEQVVAWGGILLILGIIHMIGGVGVLAHRRWGRAFGIVLGLIGFIFGLAIIFSAIGWEILDGVAPDSALTGEEASVGAGVLIAATYLLVLAGMFVGRRHFRKMGVEG